MLNEIVVKYPHTQEAIQASGFLIQDAIAFFFRDCGRYPTSDEGFKALLTNPGLGTSSDDLRQQERSCGCAHAGALVTRGYRVAASRPCLPTTTWVDSSSTSDLRRFGALLTGGWPDFFGSPDNLEKPLDS